MNIFNAYRRTRFFLWVNMAGLAIGLTVAIMLILFVVNELSYDKHFAGHERIVRLISAMESRGKTEKLAINLRKAYTELPDKTPGIEAVAQMYFERGQELTFKERRFQQLNMLYTDPEFFRVFRMKFLEGTPDNAIETAGTVVITRKYAEIIFGNTASAMGETVGIGGADYTVSAVVEELPSNTHFSFDVLRNISGSFIAAQQSLEFLTYIRIKDNAPLEETRAAIENNYTEILLPFASRFSDKSYGITEKLTDVYLNSDVIYGGLKKNSMAFIRILLIVSLFVLSLAIVNFINLFTAQCEARMLEIGIRKTNGASVGDIVRQFFREVSVIVLITFAAGLFLARTVTPYFSKLIDKDIDLKQLLNPQFILCILLLFVITVVLSASYTAFYMSRFSPLDIIGKRLKLSKHRLTPVLIVFQSAVTIVLVSYILVINRQISYLRNLPQNYNTENVMVAWADYSIVKDYNTLIRELQNTPGIQRAAGGDHFIGGGCSGQSINLPDNPETDLSINEYRIKPGLCEVMEFQPVEGRFFREDDPEGIRNIILNEAAVRMLGLQPPVAGQKVSYKGEAAEVIGVVKDFIYDSPSGAIAPLALTPAWHGATLHIRFDSSINRIQAEHLAQDVFRKFSPDFILEPRWCEDMYDRKFENFNTQFRVILIGSLLSVLIAMIGLLSTHLYITKRRMKETGIRRINGATAVNIFTLLSMDIIKWVLIAGVIAAPVTWYVVSGWLSNYANRIPLNGAIFLLPVLIQCLIALAVTSGVSLNVARQNPVNSLKSD